MPFKSTAERGFLYANHPDIAKRFQAETPKGTKLPHYVAKKPAAPKFPKKPLGAASLYGSK